MAGGPEFETVLPVLQWPVAFASPFEQPKVVGVPPGMQVLSASSPLLPTLHQPEGPKDNARNKGLAYFIQIPRNPQRIQFHCYYFVNSQRSQQHFIEIIAQGFCPKK
jgi:hypothetical protein